MAMQRTQIENIYFLKEDCSHSTFDEDDENATTSTETQGKSPLPYKWDSLLDPWLCSISVPLGSISDHEEENEFDVIYSADDEVYDVHPIQAGRQRSASSYSSRKSHKTVTDRAVSRKPLSRTIRLLIEDLEVEREESGPGKVEEVFLAGLTDTLSDNEVEPQDHKHNSEKEVYAQEEAFREPMYLEEYRYENTRNDISVHPRDEENAEEWRVAIGEGEKVATKKPTCITKDEKTMNADVTRNEKVDVGRLRKRDTKNERAKILYMYLTVLGEEMNAERDD
jgi:hypothetical protein